MKRFAKVIGVLAVVGILAVLLVHELSKRKTNKAYPKPLQQFAIIQDLPAPLAIRAAVYRELLGKKGSGDAKFYGAYFLEVSNSEKKYFLTLFTNWSPRVEVETNNALITKRGVFDRVTGKPASLFWARLLSLTNTRAEVDGGSYTSPLGGEESTYEVVYNGTNWVTRAKKDTIVW